MALDYNIIGERLKEARVNKKYTQENLAEKLDVSEGYILNGASNTSQEYLSLEFNSILENVSPQKQKLIYKIAKVIAEE